MRTEPLSRTERRVYLKLKHFCFGKDYTIARQSTIAEGLKLSVPTVKRAMSQLTKKGWISTKRRGNSTTKKTILGDPFRRQNKSGVTYQMQFNLIPRTTKSDPPDDPSDDPSIYNSMEASPGSRAPKPTLLKIPPRRKDPMSQMPEMYRGHAPTEKLWRGSQRWIVHNDTILITALDVPKIMQLLEAAGYLEMPEDGPLPMITWPALETTPLLKLAEAVERKPVRSLTEADYEFLKRKIGQGE